MSNLHTVSFWHVQKVMQAQIHQQHFQQLTENNILWSLRTSTYKIIANENGVNSKYKYPA